MKFVRAKKDHPVVCLGIGKVVDEDGDYASVAWFDSPITEPRTKRIPKKELTVTRLEPQTRVYWLDPGVGGWRVGRVNCHADDSCVEVIFPNRNVQLLPVEELHVRWDLPIEDPSPYLAERLNETPLFAQGRACFSETMIRQRGACSGMSGLISSVIELELHQYEVVKRVLQDPVQRYLLADEVGLGKTIEAGVLIRQHVLDCPDDHQVLVITPPALCVQWRRELRDRFLLGDRLGDSLDVVAMDADARDLRDLIGLSSMVVIDEAHHLSRDTRLYDALRDSIIDAPRLLLLSATPALHNERGFLRMLHLLDPNVHRLEDVDGFRQRIEHRQALAESVAGLVPQNLYVIDGYLDDLCCRFPDDDLLKNHACCLRDIVARFPDESDEEFNEVLTKLRAHLTETYRLDRRILRNRRADIKGLTPNRAGVKPFLYSSAYIRRFIEVAERWRTLAADTVYGREESEEAKSLADWYSNLLAALFTDETEAVSLVQCRLNEGQASIGEIWWEREILLELEEAAIQCVSGGERFVALQALVHDQVQAGAKIIVFCAHKRMADAAAIALRDNLAVIVDRHTTADPQDDSRQDGWEGFLHDPAHQVLVCDADAEEGLNLQGGEKVIVHLDLPLSPNRIEQRLGRVDRYGSGDAILSFALCCRDDPFYQSWLNYLDEGLGVFARSVASLQYLIDDDMQSLTQSLFYEGVEAIDDLKLKTGGDEGRAKRELRRIDQQDQLDALTLFEQQEHFENLEDVDMDWREVGNAVHQWMLKALQIEKEEDGLRNNMEFGYGTFRFCFSFVDQGRNTLIPVTRILSGIEHVIDRRARGSSRRLPKTKHYSCRRAAATHALTQAKSMRLVRWGDELIDCIQKFTDLDDRGRTSALWREHQRYNALSGERADTFLKFDFVVEVDIQAVLLELDGQTDPVLETSLSRRGDMALPPFFASIWLDESLTAVKDPNLIRMLEAPYRKGWTDDGYRDRNLNLERWELMDQLGLPVINSWRGWIPQARVAAEQLLREETDLDLKCQEAIKQAKMVDEARFAQLQTRIRCSDTVLRDSTASLLEEEERISRALYNGIKLPKVTLETISAVFISQYPLS